ncbi:bifunctional transcriptional activator/DNA repair enzyme AdaA [Halocynthiibacter styelae]|uniref:methylated-DNA--[protein]-cysteine S-methyltransferase n=1 Tax=Halocynthiibacter styelae TaxID=2761955 RepID=A0A8J7J2Z1_9RHOB|nr:trifunctional transcriptional activator/DNA repair protein Ada/methylated-DNA--[protein]-cysteine S-methyltransferase [Paenihalocynthiibacter styelae]MBI1492165.1 bifunctional transcriptional activator/DNA repair protein Ada [Paenihalocynthiibacter styelae]
MLFQLPEHKVLYEALTKRDPAWDGRAWVCVSTTGIFCRLSCPARDPKPENCAFKPSVTECIEAGFRPCKRCHPLGVLSDDPIIADLVKALEKDPAKRWYESDIAQIGYDPSTVRRNFKRVFGMTFLEMARQRRLAMGFTTMAEGSRVIDAQLEAGFESPSAFRDAFARLTGVAPGAFRKDALLQADWFQTELGPMIAVADKRHLHLLEFADRKALPTELKRLMKDCPGGIGFGRPAPIEQVKTELELYFQGQSAVFSTPLAPHGTAFQKDIWDALRKIPAGEIRSYSTLATDLGRPEATRAVARANGANSIAILIPCHRVMGADGSLTGYGGGIWRKEKLIEIEKKYASETRV